MQLPLEDVTWRAARIDTDQVHFKEAFSKLRVKTSTTKKVSTKRSNAKFVDADCQLFKE